MRSSSSEPERLTGDVVRFGKVTEVDLASARCVVEAGDLATGPIPWLAARAGSARTWWAPSVGEQVVLLCAEGDVEGGVLLGGVYCNDHAAPASDTSARLVFEDGAVISYDPINHALTFTLPGDGTTTIVSPGGVSIQGDLTVAGDVSIDGAVDSSGDMTAAGISQVHHTHPDVQSGSSHTGEAE